MRNSEKPGFPTFAALGKDMLLRWASTHLSVLPVVYRIGASTGMVQLGRVVQVMGS